MIITSTHVNYYHVCHRKLWLFANGVNMEHTSDTVYDGKLLHESSYPQRAEKYTEIQLSANYNDLELNGKIDFYDAPNKVIHETKRSDKVETAHEWQVKYYIWLFELSGIMNVHAILEYPTQRQTEEVWLTDSGRDYLRDVIYKIISLVGTDVCPPKINAKICKSCSYYELCYVSEI